MLPLGMRWPLCYLQLLSIVRRCFNILSVADERVRDQQAADVRCHAHLEARLVHDGDQEPEEVVRSRRRLRGLPDRVPYGLMGSNHHLARDDRAAVSPSRHGQAASAALWPLRRREGTPMTRRNWYAVVAVLLVLAYACVPRGTSPPATTTTTPPATGTGTTR